MGLGPIFKRHNRLTLASDAAADADARCLYSLTGFPTNHIVQILKIYFLLSRWQANPDLFLLYNSVLFVIFLKCFLKYETVIKACGKNKSGFSVHLVTSKYISNIPIM